MQININDNTLTTDSGVTVKLNGKTWKAMGMAEDFISATARAQKPWGKATQEFLDGGGKLNITPEFEKEFGKPPAKNGQNGAVQAPPTPATPPSKPMTREEELLAQIAQLKAEKTALEASRGVGITIKVRALGEVDPKTGEAFKGNVVVYGLNWRPYSFYKSQIRKMQAEKVMDRLIAICDADDKLPPAKRQLSEKTAKDAAKA
jgi:hypothetical protein